MKVNLFLAGLTVLAVLGLGSARLSAAEEDGVALAIVYDTSGSMKDPVRDSNGKSCPKFVIANRALVAVAQQLQSFATNSAAAHSRKLHTGLLIFEGEGVRPAIPFGPFDAAAIQKFANQFSSPSGNTPLGNALRVAAQSVMDSPLPRKHVLVITDGMNTAGPTPAVVLPRLKQQAEQKQTSFSVHFVAFDVDAKVFAPLKRLGATVVGAADEKQLDTQLQFILQRKILLEDEEPNKP
ncbi:MAG TPA: vWA domain-containing protein [Candidatus Sulfotelmatobacter sp.]|nr:vWA domain-containing protein [Candidatus Sulfotelmatobacter sp.]HWI59626.1 vWA domain-containing protein [Bacillota bacterium]